MKAKHFPPQRIEASAPRPGMTNLGMSAARLGDLAEMALAEQLGWKPLVGALAGRARQGAFDMEMPDGRWVEVKTVTVYAVEYKVKPLARDVREKLAWADRHDRDAATVMVVVDEKRKARVYVRDGLGCFRLPVDGANWEYVGKVKI